MVIKNFSKYLLLDNYFAFFYFDNFLQVYTLENLQNKKLLQKHNNFFFSFATPRMMFQDSLNKQIATVAYHKNAHLVYSIPKLLGSYFRPYWFKVVFRGKGFRIRNWKKKKKLTLNFGKSHWTKIIFFSRAFYFFKLQRQSYIISHRSKKSLLCLGQLIMSIKQINKYTKRGLRLKKQAIIRRFGKISQVISSVYK